MSDADPQARADQPAAGGQAVAAAGVASLAQVVDCILDIVLLAGDDASIVGCNAAAVAAYGYSREELATLRVVDIRAPEARAEAAAQWSRILLPEGLRFETVHMRKDGATFPVEVSARAVEGVAGVRTVAVVRDISERRVAEARIAFLNRLLRTITEVNQLIVREREPARLLEAACRVIVEHGELHMAWVGMVDRPGGTVRPVARAGTGVEYVEAAEVRSDDSPLGRGPTGVAIRERRAVVANDWETDGTVAPWREQGRLFGIRASAAFPIEVAGEVVGALNVYAVSPGLFVDEIVALLAELAADLAFALETMRLREAHEAATRALRASEARYRELFEGSRSCVAVYEAVDEGSDFVFRDLNAAAERIEGVPRQDVLGRRVTEVFPGVVEFGLLELFRSVWRSGVPERHPLTLYRDDRISGWRENYVYRLPSGEVVAVYDDVTEQKQAEEALRASEQEFRAVFHGSNDAIFIHDLQGRVLDANEAASRLLGYTTDELRALRVTDVDTPVEAREAEERIARLAAEGRLVFETEHRRKEGSAVPIEVSASLFQYRGAPAVMSICRTIEERRRAEAALRDAALHWSSTFDALQDAITVLDVRGRVMQWNKAFPAFVGVPPDQIFGRRCSVLVHGSEARAAGCPLARMMDSGQHEEAELLLGERWAHIAVDPMRDEEGRLTGAVHVMSDITARRRGEEERLRLVAAVEQAAETILITDTEGRIQYVNPAFTAVTGYDRAEVVGQTPRVLKSGQHSVEVYRELWQTLGEGRTWHGHLVNRRKDGSLYEEEATISPVRDEAGSVVSFVAVKRDISQEVALESQLRQAQKMEAIGNLAGGVAHDFNNLLQAMLSLIEVARSRRDDQERGDGHLAELEENVRRGAHLTRQLLLFSRREATRVERLDLNEVLLGATTMLRHLLRENIAIALELARGELGVDADRGQLEQVVTNLALNAADAMPEGGRLSIRSGQDGAVVWCEVEDTGIGIPEAIRDRIFEPFFTTKGSGQGTGLGLSVVHGIVTGHGGRIEVTSRVGDGSRFRVVLPVGRHAPRPVARLPEEYPQILPEGWGERILLVEDEPGAREALRNILTTLGYRATGVASGEEALAQPETPTFDVLLTDVMLPGVSGPDASCTLRERWPGLKVILMSGYAQDEAVRRVVALGGVRFLQKPFDMATLARELRAALEE